MNEEKLNQRLKRFREQKGLNAKQMAKLIDTAETTYRDWESGRSLRNIPPFQKICEVLSISVTELIVGQQPERQELIDESAQLLKNYVKILTQNITTNLI